MTIIKAIIKWIFSKDSFEQILFVLNTTKILFGNNKNKKLVNMLNTAHDMVDNINKLIPNTKTKEMQKIINEDTTAFKGMRAEIVENKHGRGNSGLKISYGEKNGLEGSINLGF